MLTAKNPRAAVRPAVLRGFNVRVGEHLHRNLAMHAAEDGMSLNQYVVKKLASG